MSYCNGCGNECMDGDKHCRQCGAELEDSALRCLCGAEVGADDKFCHKCGAEIATEEAEDDD